MKPAKKQLDGRYVITVCADGAVSIRDIDDKQSKRRLGSALPAFAVDDLLDAFEIVRRCTHLSLVHYGGKTGTLIEPRVIGWPRYHSDLSDLEKAGAEFRKAWEALEKERLAARNPEFAAFTGGK